ncbi:MAG: hypothetical protein GC168_16770 [Candidatus Hydrogenedens sp.]|nr:hypothetical protein [Candidatus Hydrogenedens sp.]
MDREPHFLDAYVEELKQEPDWESTDRIGAPWYNAHGDCVMFITVNEGVVADRIDEYLTLYRSALDNRAIGFQLKGIHALLNEFGYDVARIRTALDQDEVAAVELSMMLFSSYTKRPETQKRKLGYAEAACQLPATQRV